MERRMTVVLFLCVFIFGERAHAAPETWEKTPEEKKLEKLVEELSAKGDVDGLLAAEETVKKMRASDRRYHHIGSIESAIITQLGNLKAVKALDIIIDRAREDHSYAIGALSRIGTERAIDALIEISRGKGRIDSRRYALSALGGLGGPKAKEVLFGTLCDLNENEKLRSVAAETLAKRMTLDEADWKRYFALFENGDDPLVKRLHSLLRLCSPAAITPLLQITEKLCKLDSEKTRETALMSLRLVGALAGKYYKKLGYRGVGERDSTYEKQGRKCTISKDGKDILVYYESRLENDPAERARVLEFWKNWWKENTPAIVKIWEYGRKQQARNFVGKSYDQVVKVLGRPDSERRVRVDSRRHLNSSLKPEGLGADDWYRRTLWRNVGGRDFHLFFVTPKIYRRVSGSEPGRAKLYAIEAVECELNSNRRIPGPCF